MQSLVLLPEVFFSSHIATFFSLFRPVYQKHNHLCFPVCPSTQDPLHPCIGDACGTLKESQVLNKSSSNKIFRIIKAMRSRYQKNSLEHLRRTKKLVGLNGPTLALSADSG